MTVKIHDCEQGTPEWYAARCGVLTASTIGKLITATGKIANNEASRGIALELLAERITGLSDEPVSTRDMERGHEDEIWARDLYTEKLAPVREVGFITREFDGFTLGYSPDGLVGEDGAVEFKSRKQIYQIRTILNRTVPSEYVAQLQTGLMVSGRKWIDFCSYPANGGGKMMVLRVFPDPKYQALLAEAAFNCEAAIAWHKAEYDMAMKDVSVRFFDTVRRKEERIHL